MRQYGILLHISSLPSAWGIGDLGPSAHGFAAALSGAGASLWQFLPLNPTSTFIGNSPYSSPSAFAGNPLFISPELLVKDGWISYADIDGSFACLPDGRVGTEPSRVDYDVVTRHREYLLNAAFSRSRPRLDRHDGFQEFIAQHHYWLQDYARFVSLKAAFSGRSWVDWPEEFRLRDPEALARWDAEAAQPILREQFVQYLFFSQWFHLRETCNAAGISLLADIPIYVTHDSVDVWSHPKYYDLDETMRPIKVSGVPPDYFSETGQRWGTPVYRWDVMAEDGFAWWKQRLGHTLLLADMARLDHFRGFCGYWEIPAEEETAIRGEWKKAPARKLFMELKAHFGSLPFLAEDLGVITPDVRKTMRDFNLPGMNVLQFAFGGEQVALNPDIPHSHKHRSFVYTGTHDNASTKSWFRSAGDQERANLAAYTGLAATEDSATRNLARLAFASVADCAVVPMQDALHLGDEGRMNVPGVASGNWTWRMLPEEADPVRLTWLKEFARLYGRLPEMQHDEEGAEMHPLADDEES